MKVIIEFTSASFVPKFHLKTYFYFFAHNPGCSFGSFTLLLSLFTCAFLLQYLCSSSEIFLLFLKDGILSGFIS